MVRLQFASSLALACLAVLVGCNPRKPSRAR